MCVADLTDVLPCTGTVTVPYCRYANNIPWNVDMMTYGYTKCTAASSSHGAPSCEDYYHVDLSAFENFNRDNNGGAPPVIYYVYHHVDGSSPAMGGRVGHGIALQRIEGTINAQITITFTVTVRSQTMHPVEVSPAGRFRNSTHPSIKPRRCLYLCL
jgi:hypothetical protein